MSEVRKGRPNKPINLILLDSMLLGQFEYRHVQEPPMMVVDAREHMMARLLVQPSGQYLHQLRVFGEGDRGFDLVPVPQRIHRIGCVADQFIGQVADLRHQHEQPGLNRHCDDTPVAGFVSVHHEEREDERQEHEDDEVELEGVAV